jgi:cytoskeletal protein CcmA (bactofilin family)
MFGNKEVKDMKPETRETHTTNPTTPATTTVHHTQPTVSPVLREKKTGSVIGEGVSINGTMRVEGTLVIHGEFEGAITCSEQLIIGRSARVKADLDVGSATIGGRVEGRIYAKERVELETNSHLKGDVHAKSFVIQDGCFFQGNCAMGEAHDTSRRPSFTEKEHKTTTTTTQQAA